MKVLHDPENEIRITDDENKILLKFYECTDGYLVSYDDKRVANDESEINTKGVE